MPQTLLHLSTLLHIGHLVGRPGVFGEIVLNRVYLMVDEVLLAFDVTSKAANPIINGDTIRIEPMDQIVEGFER